MKRETTTYIEGIRDWSLRGDVPSVTELGLDVICIHIVTAPRWDALKTDPRMIEWIDIVIAILRAFLNARNTIFLRTSVGFRRWSLVRQSLLHAFELSFLQAKEFVRDNMPFVVGIRGAP